VATWYDQSGVGNHIVNYATSSTATVTLKPWGSVYVLSIDGALVMGGYGTMTGSGLNFTNSVSPQAVYATLQPSYSGSQVISPFSTSNNFGFLLSSKSTALYTSTPFSFTGSGWSGGCPLAQVNGVSAPSGSFLSLNQWSTFVIGQSNPSALTNVAYDAGKNNRGFYGLLAELVLSSDLATTNSAASYYSSSLLTVLTSRA
jgi:hypothetical protein